MYKYLIFCFICVQPCGLFSKEEVIINWVGCLDEEGEVASRRESGPTFYDRNKWALKKRWKKENHKRICEQINRDDSCSDQSQTEKRE